MADISTNVKLLQGTEAKMSGDQTPDIINGQLYFATIDEGQKGYIYLDSGDKRYSFGKYATMDSGGNEIVSTYINNLNISNMDFSSPSIASRENLYLRGYTPGGAMLPRSGEEINYTIPAASSDMPGLLSLEKQVIHGDKVFNNIAYFGNTDENSAIAYYIDNTGSGKINGLIADNNTTFSNLTSVAPDSLIDSTGFNICLQNSGNNNTTGLLLTSSSQASNGFIQYEYTGVKGQLTLGINSANEGDEIVIQSPGENSIQHYNDLTQTYSTIFDSGNFQPLKINVFSSETDYNDGTINFVCDGVTGGEVYVGNAFQSMEEAIEDSATAGDGINATYLNGYSYFDIAEEMLLSDSEVAELMG